jgi:hypothetical protein
VLLATAVWRVYTNALASKTPGQQKPGHGHSATGALGSDAAENSTSLGRSTRFSGADR